jgi:site-specific recombinase XerD
VNEVIAKFEAYLLTEKRVSLNTFNAYKSDLAQVVDFLMQRNEALDKATKQDFKNYLEQLTKNKMSPRSRARKLSTLKAFYSWAEDKLGWQNCTLDLAFPKLDKKLPNYLTENEIEQLLEAAQKDKSVIGERNKVMLYLLYVSGVRISELISIKLSDIQFDSGFLQVLGKGSKERLIPLPHPMLIVLRNYVKEVHKQLLPKGYDAQAVEFLFPVVYAGKIKPISRQSFWIILKTLCIKAKIDRRVSPHTLRHSLATHLLKKGANLRSIQMLLGHETIATMQVYTHVETEYLRKIYDKKHPRA